MKEDIDKLVKDYADSERSDTFVSYNDAIDLAREVRRLRLRYKECARLLSFFASQENLGMQGLKRARSLMSDAGVKNRTK